MYKLVSLTLFALAAVSAVSGSPVTVRAASPQLGNRDLQIRGGPVHSPNNASQPDGSSPAPGDDDDDDDCGGYDDDDNNDGTKTYVQYSPVPGSSTPVPALTPGTPGPSPTPSTPGPSPTPSVPEPSSTPSTAEPSSTPVGSTPSETHTDGHVTWYTQDGNAGACGEKHSDDDFIAALDYRTYGDLSSKSKYCGQKIRVSWQGKSVDVTVEDACPSCYNSASVDLSQAAFKALASLDVGELTGATWVLL